MGMSPDNTEGPFVETDAPEAPPAAPDPNRDTDRLAPDDWPARPLPTDLSGRKSGFQVIFRKTVLDDIRTHGESSIEVEVCGVLVGSVYHDAAGPYCYVAANIRGNYASGRNAQVTFTSETWTHIHDTMDKQYPDQRIVGWYHTHPGFGIFLSEMDLFIQQHFFSEPWQIAYVYDPKGKDRGSFVWHKGQAVREEFLVEDDTKPLPKPTEVQRDGISESSPPIELSARVRDMEKQVRRLQGKITRTRLFMILWPLLVVAFLFVAGVLPPSGLRKFVPPNMWPARVPATQPNQ
jgi:proteasome lid subunit RPN8/RPN11